MSTTTASRSRMSLALATALALVGAMLTLALPSASATPSPSVIICHATNSQSNPYTRNRVNTSSIDEEGNRFLNGHGEHTGPVWFEGIGVTWGDIIPAFSYTNPRTGVTTSYPGLNLTSEGTEILANGCKSVPEVVVEFDLTSSECVVGADGKSATLSVTNRQSSTESIDFTLTGPGTAVLGGAGLQPGATQTFIVAESGFGTWVLSVDGQEATATVTLTDAGCPTDIVPPVTPSAPTFVEPTCTSLDGAAVKLPADTKEVSYTLTGTPAPGASLSVKATANEGYTIVEGATTEWSHTFRTVAELNCAPAIDSAPVTAPAFADATCEAPDATAMVIPADTDEINYETIGTATPGTTVTVIATPIGNVVLADYPAKGWSHTFPAVPTNCSSAVGGNQDTDTDTPTVELAGSDDEDDQAVAGSEDALASTGASFGPAGLALMLILSGAAFVGARRLALK